MNFCTKCGAKIEAESKFCQSCGSPLVDGSIESTYQTVSIENNKPKKTNSTVSLVAFIFMIFGCISYGLFLIPLIWCLPLTIKYYKHMKEGTNFSTGLKVCSLLFVSIIGGICMLVED